MLPIGVEELRRAGHEVILEAGAGLGSGITDAEYEAAGATIVQSHEEVFAQADLVVKVKEPLESEMAAAASRPDPVHVFSFRRRRNTHTQRPGNGRHSSRVRNSPWTGQRPATTHSDERSCRPYEHPGRRKVSGASAGRKRDSVGRCARGRTGHTLLFLAVVSSERMPHRLQPGFRRTWSSSTSTLNA